MKETTKATYELLDIARLLRELKDEKLQGQYPETFALGCQIYKERLEKLEKKLEELKWISIKN